MGRWAGPIIMLLLALPAAAQGIAYDLRLPGLAEQRMGLGNSTIPLSLALLVITIYAAAISILHIRARRHWNEHFEEQNRALQESQARSERVGLFLAADRQVMVAWNGPGGEPEIEGDLGILMEATHANRVLSFSNWLDEASAQALGQDVLALRNEGKAFNRAFKTLRGDFVECDARPVAGRAVMAIRLTTGDRLEIARLEDVAAAQNRASVQLRAILEAISQPVWLRDEAGRLSWVNPAYVGAVEGGSSDQVVARQSEFLDTDDRSVIRTVRQAQGRYQGRVTAIISGERRTVDVIEVANKDGGSGIAFDVSELEAVHHALERQMEAHVRTLDELPSAVAIFDRRQVLSYSNRAFRELFGLDNAFLAGRPSNGEWLDRLRAGGRLPETGDYKEFKTALIGLYAQSETSVQGWNLPNGRALRVVISPNPQGGVTYLFEDETERFTLATSYDQLKNTQWETLMALSEGVAVFGSDGKLELSNPAFQTFWGLSDSNLDEKPHVEDLARRIDQPVWREISGLVCALGDARTDQNFTTTTREGRILALTMAPLPDGATLITATDITDTVEAERLLREHNGALEKAARLRTDFIKSVSFELRDPLNSVVGLAQALAQGHVGPLSEKQQGYAEDLARVSDAVLALTNDILDLATVESRSIDLKCEQVDISRAIQDAMAGLKDRLGEATQVRLSINISGDAGQVWADQRRLTHILFNLLANGLGFSRPGDTMRLMARREGAGVQISLHDAARGPGMSDGGAFAQVERENGLRYSLAKALVQLHGGRIEVQDDPSGGQITSVILPDQMAMAA